MNTYVIGVRRSNGRIEPLSVVTLPLAWALQQVAYWNRNDAERAYYVLVFSTSGWEVYCGDAS